MRKVCPVRFSEFDTIWVVRDLFSMRFLSFKLVSYLFSVIVVLVCVFFPRSLSWLNMICVVVL